jgi:hypothetical protein
MMQLFIDESRRRYNAMKNARRMLVGFYIFISVLYFLSLGGCVRGNYRGDNRRYSREERHYYRDGRWYRHDSRGNEIVVTVLATGALIESLPPQHTTIVVQGAPYYHDDNYYYRQAPNGGYVVVSAPVIVQPKSKSNYGKQGEKGGNKHN